MFTCLSPNGAQLTTGVGAVKRLLVATIRGVYTLDRQVGNSWTVAAKALEHLQISSLLQEPQSGRIFAGTHGNGGLWSSDDGGTSWVEKTCGLGSKHIYTVAAQLRGEKAVIWVGAEPPMLLRSTDLGESFVELPGIRNVPDTDQWTFPPPPHVAHVKHVAFHPAIPGTLYVCIEQGALLKSTDDGQSWRELHGYEQPDMDIKFRHDLHRVAILPSNPQVIYCSAGEGVYVSRNGGGEWQQLQSRFDRIGYPDCLFLDPRDERVIYVGGAGDAPREWRTTRISRAGVIRSGDGGATWQEVMGGLPVPIKGNIEAMAHHHAGDYLAIVAGTATGEVYLTEDDGKYWQCVASGLPPISKAGHYRWFLSDEEHAAIDKKMYAWKDQARA
jgi:photosystem II stability/assembly factor-like uncharacterized protein